MTTSVRADCQTWNKSLSETVQPVTGFQEGQKHGRNETSDFKQAIEKMSESGINVGSNLHISQVNEFQRQNLCFFFLYFQ